MIFRIALISTLISLVTCSFVQGQSEAPKLEESYEDAMQELSKMMDTMDMNKIFDEGFAEFFQFDFNDPNMNLFDGLLDSLPMNEFFGGSEFDALKEQFEEMDTDQFNEMLEQSMGMLQQMDMSEFQKIFEQLDFSELQKMFEGMNPQDFNFGVPPAKPSEEKDGERKYKKL